MAEASSPSVVSPSKAPKRTTNISSSVAVSKHRNKQLGDYPQAKTPFNPFSLAYLTLVPITSAVSYDQNVPSPFT